MTVQNNLLTDANHELEIAAAYELLATLEVMQENVNLLKAGNTGNLISTSAQNLYQVAADQYGDATLWYVIAQANLPVIKTDDFGFIDINLVGVVNLVIPPQPVSSNGGIIGY